MPALLLTLLRPIRELQVSATPIAKETDSLFGSDSWCLRCVCVSVEGLKLHVEV